MNMCIGLLSLRRWGRRRSIRFAHVILAPGACGRGGSEQRLLPPFLRDPVDPRDSSPKTSFGPTLHHFWLLGGSKNSPKACFGATLHHDWLCGPATFRLRIRNLPRALCRSEGFGTPHFDTVPSASCGSAGRKLPTRRVK